LIVEFRAASVGAAAAKRGAIKPYGEVTHSNRRLGACLSASGDCAR
jgi:hypothetical protein